MRQYLQHEDIARDFAAYLALYKKYQDDYGVEAILAGQAAPSVFARAFDAAFDERLSLVSLLLSGLNTRFEAAQFQDSLTDEVYQELKRLRPTLVNGQEAPASLLRAQIAARQARFDQKKKADLATAADAKLHKQAQARLEEYAALLADEPFLTGEDAFGLVQEAFTRQVEQREAAATEAGRALEAAFDFMEKAFGPGQEMVVFITELSLGPASGPFIAENGCERYDQYSQNLLLDSRRAEACSANFEKVRRYVKRLCTRVLPRCPDDCSPSEELRLLSAITPKGMVFYRGTVEALADRYVVFRDDYGAVSRLLLELIRAEALARGYHIITCPCAMHPEDQIDHIFIPALRLAFLTDNLWHPIQLPGVQAVRCTRFVDRENLSGFRARLRFNDRAASELIDQAVALMAQAKNCHDELETYYRAAVDFDQVNAVAANCQKILGLG